ncbi:MAG: dCTP deaminase [Halobacteriovoraceae bacterium]|nr:dCTP deaminase [Halobacteriovoraceae bacterium]
MILSDKEILASMEKELIVIRPFDPKCLGSNSYDVHLGHEFAVYTADVLDAKKDNPIDYFTIPEEGYVVYPGQLYLGVTKEYTETKAFVPFLEGKSSAGRLGIDIHATAGKGDVGFCNHWTLEISCKRPVRLYRDMPIGQIIYFSIQGNVEKPYDRKESAKYNQISDRPVPSMMWKNFI